jgi:regulator of replication initiation timing
MNRAELKKAVADIAQQIESVADENVKSILKVLLNLVESLVAENESLQSENQKLKDELSRLKGEQGKPDIRKQSNTDHSSEKDRKPRGKQGKKKNKKSKKKKHKIKIDRMEVCDIDQSQLPPDAKFKGYQSVVVQDIVIQTNNIKFKKKVYYSPSLKKTFIADLPAGYQGEFGPKIKALVLDLHQTHKMTESAIHAFLTNHEIVISPATIARMLTDDPADFHQEKADIVDAGLASSIHQQMDDTGARVRGKNYYTHILCNDFYTAYFTRPNKDRLTVVEILTQGEVMFEFNESSYALMEQMKLPEKQLTRLRMDVKQTRMNRSEVDVFLNGFFPNPNKHTTNRRIILEASAIVAYQQSQRAVAILLTDDAPQFKQITELLALCWIHDGRHYKKLNPFVDGHRNLLNEFRTRYWDYYHKLLDYKAQPTAELAQTLEQEFDVLFSTKTGYVQLDERIEKTQLKKESLLLVLKHPTLPLHNNASELGARVPARYRDISFHTMSKKGTEAKDTFMTIVETAKKLAVNTYHYFYDRISKKREMPSLASLIEQNAKQLAPDTG